MGKDNTSLGGIHISPSAVATIAVTALVLRLLAKEPPA